MWLRNAEVWFLCVVFQHTLRGGGGGGGGNGAGGRKVGGRAPGSMVWRGGVSEEAEPRMGAATSTVVARPRPPAVSVESRAKLQAQAQLSTLTEQLAKNVALQTNRALLDRLPDGGIKVKKQRLLG